MKRWPVLLLCLSSFAAHAEPFTSTPPPWWFETKTKWVALLRQTAAVGRAAARYVAGANADCIAATALEEELRTAAEASDELHADFARDPQETKPEVAKGRQADVLADAERNRRDKCDGPDGGSGSANLRAFVRWASQEKDLTLEPVKTRKRVAAALALAAGVGVGAAESVGASVGAAAAGSPILLMTPRQVCAAHPGLPGCPAPDGT